MALSVVTGDWRQGETVLDGILTKGILEYHNSDPNYIAWLPFYEVSNRRINGKNEIQISL